MREIVDLVLATLKAGMTTDVADSENYYVKEWYTGDPLSLPMVSVPAGSVSADIPSNRVMEFVGMDTETLAIAIRFYQLGSREYNEAAEIAAGVTKLYAMIEKALALLRTDPTFGCNVVMSEIREILPQVMGVSGENVYRIAQIKMEAKRRVLWGQ